MIAVPSFFAAPPAVATKTARPVSSLDIGLPTQTGANHLLGYCLGGVRAVMNCQGDPSVTSPVFYFKTYRHPNCDYMMFAMRPRWVASQTGTITVRAGTGATKTVSFYDGDTESFALQDAPFDSGDSGDVQLSVSCSQARIGSLTIWDVARTTLASGEKCLLAADATYTRIGHVEGLYIAESDQAGPHGMVQAIYDCWDEYQPQIIGWALDDTNAFTTTSTSYVPILGSTACTFSHKARQKKSGTTVTTSRWHIRSWCESGTSTEYMLKVTSGSDAVESATLSNTSASWQDALTGLEIDNTADDDLTVEVKRTAGTGEVYVTAVSGIEDS